MNKTLTFKLHVCFLFMVDSLAVRYVVSSYAHYDGDGRIRL